jgi:hypothetical protein
MGASSSSSFWSDMSYDHSMKQLTSIYEKKSRLMPDAKIVEYVHFTIGDAMKLLDKENLYLDISLVLDIDFTLGQASTITYDNVNGYLLDDKKTDLVEINRLIEEGKAAWFHDKTCVFFLRPYFKEFIRFCDKNFKEVIIWTNGIQKHADNMIGLVESIIGKKWKGYGRNYSISDRKIVTTIGLEPTKTWMVDDDHRHHYIDADRDVTREVNPDIKFFHGPEFSMAWFKDLHERIPKWNREIQSYDDWFLFLIWNWNYMREHNIEMLAFIRNENRFISK